MKPQVGRHNSWLKWLFFVVLSSDRWLSLIPDATKCGLCRGLKQLLMTKARGAKRRYQAAMQARRRRAIDDYTR